jgi:hypothetical protein
MMTLDDLIGSTSRTEIDGRQDVAADDGRADLRLLAAGVPSPFGSGATPERYPHGRQANQFAFS